MAPQESKPSQKHTMGNDAFLVKCIKHCKEKLNVDWDEFSKETGMSAGGARNKFRIVMRNLEEAGAAWSTKDAQGNPVATSTRKASVAGTKRKALEVKEKKPKVEKTEGGNDIDSDETVAAATTAADEGEPPTKKKMKVFACPPREPKAAADEDTATAAAAAAVAELPQKEPTTTELAKKKSDTAKRAKNKSPSTDPDEKKPAPTPAPAPRKKTTAIKTDGSDQPVNEQNVDTIKSSGVKEKMEGKKVSTKASAAEGQVKVELVDLVVLDE